MHGMGVSQDPGLQYLCLLDFPCALLRSTLSRKLHVLIKQNKNKTFSPAYFSLNLCPVLFSQ